MPARASETVLALPALPARPRDSNKGSFGRVLVVAGSSGMSGAATLCAMGALRSGAGLVTLAVPKAVWPFVAVVNPSYLTAPLPDDDGRLGDEAVAPLLQLAQGQTALAVGP